MPIYYSKKFFLKIVSTSVCGNISPCAAFFSETPFNVSLITIYSWDFEVSLGYNKILLAYPVLVEKGEFVYLTQSTGRIAIDTSGKCAYSDLVWKSTVWLGINKTSNWRMYINPITNFTSYEANFKISHFYKQTGFYNFSISFLSSNQKFTELVYIIDCK